MNEKDRKDTQDLNAFVDRELDSTEHETTLAEIDRDPRLRSELSELYHLKEMVRSAYSDEKGYTTGKSGEWLGLSGAIAAGIMLLATVFAGGYQLGGKDGYARDDVFHLSHSESDPGRIMLYVSAYDQQKFRQTLDQAQTYLDDYSNKGINVLVVTSADGINMLRRSITNYEQRINAMKASYGESLDFVACNNTIMKMQNEGIDVDLVHSARTAPSAVQYVVDRLKEGWTYVSI